MLTIYGSMLCKDCVACRTALDSAGVPYEYRDFADDLLNLREFLKLREQSLFDPVKEQGGIGIPCILREDGTLTLDWSEFV